MNWQEICDNPTFKNLPFKIETTKWGKIEMSPASNKHGFYQALIIRMLSKLTDKGHPISECGIQTISGVKVADVAWGSLDFFKKNTFRNPYTESPEIVVEILSPSNTMAEMDEKKELYFARGATEFWTCDQNGQMRFFNNHDEITESGVINDFPQQVVIDFA